MRAARRKEVPRARTLAASPADRGGDHRPLAHGQKVEARWRDRARICWLAHDGKRVREIVALMGLDDKT
ncbi:MAG: hypothetical protein M3490_12500, partial [Chloroflexota bacterium]|nr:hypothetical protein [Chloroflexota bacterium]